MLIYWSSAIIQKCQALRSEEINRIGTFHHFTVIFTTISVAIYSKCCFSFFSFYFNITLLQILLEIHIVHSIKLTFQSFHVFHSTFVFPEKNGEKKPHMQFVLCFLYTHWVKVNLSMAFPLNRSSPPAVPLEATDFREPHHHSLRVSSVTSCLGCYF